jgi:hypothetical protein
MGGVKYIRRGGWPRIEAGDKAAFLDALRRGFRLEDAATACGFSLAGFYGARGRDAAFKAGWAEALRVSADAERAGGGRRRSGSAGGGSGGGGGGGGGGADGAGAWIIAPNNGRRLQKRRMRHVRFDAERQRLFIDHFAGSCDTSEAAEAAGVCESTVYKHRLRNDAFARVFQAALEQGYVRLEVEAVRQRLEAQRLMGRELGSGKVPPGEVAQEFERVLKLLTRWDRRRGASGAEPGPEGGDGYYGPRAGLRLGPRPGPRTVRHERLRNWTFDEAIAALEKKLKALDIPILALPGEIVARYDGVEAGGADQEGSEPNARDDTADADGADGAGGGGDARDGDDPGAAEGADGADGAGDADGADDAGGTDDAGGRPGAEDGDGPEAGP